MSTPSALTLLSVFDTPATVGHRESDNRSLSGPGHTTTLVGNDQFLWVSGARNGAIYVIDIRDPKNPKGLGYVASPAGAAYGAFTPGVVHDVDADRFGDITLTGSGGTAVYRLSSNPLTPTLVAAVSPKDNARAQQFIHHGSQRLDADHLLVTEEDYQANCDGASHQDGSLQVWRIDRKAKRLVEVSSWDAPKGADASGPLATLCSSHWFTINSHEVVADAWYGAGRVRCTCTPTRTSAGCAPSPPGTSPPYSSLLVNGSARGLSSREKTPGASVHGRGGGTATAAHPRGCAAVAVWGGSSRPCPRAPWPPRQPGELRRRHGA